MELGFDFCAATRKRPTKNRKNSYIQRQSTFLTSALPHKNHGAAEVTSSLHPQPPAKPGTLQHQRCQKILHLPNMMKPDFQGKNLPSWLQMYHWQR